MGGCLLTRSNLKHTPNGGFLKKEFKKTYLAKENKTIKLLANKIGNEFDGKSLGIKHVNEELGDLTLNLASLEF